MMDDRMKNIPFRRRWAAKGMLKAGAQWHRCPQCGVEAPLYKHPEAGGFGGHCQACGEWVQEELCSYCRRSIQGRIDRGEIAVPKLAPGTAYGGYAGVAGPGGTYGTGTWCDQKCHDAGLGKTP